MPGDVIALKMCVYFGKRPQSIEGLLKAVCIKGAGDRIDGTNIK